MRVGGCMVVKNEADVIEQNIRFHLDKQGFDILLVVDNASTDDTWSILQDMKEPRLLLFRTGWQDGFVQDTATTEGSEALFTQHGCDWVLPIDADEYWLSETFPTVHDALSQIDPSYNLYSTFAYDFVMTELDDPNESDFRKRMQYARIHPTPKMILRKLGGQIKYIMIGSHIVYLNDESLRKEVGIQPEVLCRYHYRYISKEQIMRKILYKAEGYIVRTKGEWLHQGRKGLHGRHVRDMYFKIREGKIDELYDTLVRKEQRVQRNLERDIFFHKRKLLDMI